MTPDEKALAGREDLADMSPKSRPVVPAPVSPSAKVPPATAEKTELRSAEPSPLSPGIHPPIGYRRGEVVNIWGVPFDRVTMDDAVGAIGEMIAERTPRYVITANLNYAMLAANDVDLAPITAGASLIVADGQPIVWRSLLSGARSALPCRVAGSELIYRLAHMASRVGWRIYFLGAGPGVAQACADKLVELYPGLEIAGVQSPPYRELSEEEIRQQHDHVRAARPDLLLVAFTQPRGDKWIYENYKSLSVPVSINVGASFDFVAGSVKRAPSVCQRLGLEWFHRMSSEPRRLVPRYYRNAKFLAASLIRDWSDFVRARYGTTGSPRNDMQN